MHKKAYGMVVVDGYLNANILYIYRGFKTYKINID